MRFLAAIFAALTAVQCGPSKDDIREGIEKAKHCEYASEYQRVRSKCPFGCHVYVHEDEVERIQSLIDDYESNCVYTCIPFDRVTCPEGKCVVETDEF